MGTAFDHTTLGQRVVFGTGAAVENTVAAVLRLGAERVLLIAGDSATATADAVAAQVPIAVRIREVVQHVPEADAAAAADRARAADCDAIVSIGGGSATGLAKAVALRLGIPVIAVPTTFAGSEATDVWGITDAERKTTGTDPLALPRTVVYDADLLAGLPGDLAVASGLNAMAHAIDSLWAPRADPINRALATEGMAALILGLRALRAAPADRDARELMLYGTYLASVAFASAGSGLHHRICHVLGGAFGLPHAPTHAVMLRYVVAFNAPASPDAAARISAAFAGAPAASALFAFEEELAAPRSLAELGLAQDDIAHAATLTLAAVPASNPRPVTLEDLERLLHAAWAGAPFERGRP